MGNTDLNINGQNEEKTESLYEVKFEFEHPDNDSDKKIIYEKPCILNEKISEGIGCFFICAGISLLILAFSYANSI